MAGSRGLSKRSSRWLPRPHRQPLVILLSTDRWDPQRAQICLLHRPHRSTLAQIASSLRGPCHHQMRRSQNWHLPLPFSPLPRQTLVAQLILEIPQHYQRTLPHQPSTLILAQPPRASPITFHPLNRAILAAKPTLLTSMCENKMPLRHCYL